MLVKKQNGFTLIEAIITILVMSILFLGVYELIIFSIKITGDNKHRMAATIIANQKMERIRNLPYNDIGTISGMVNGVIQDNEVVQQGGDVFNVNTFVKYEDDAFDSISIADGGTDEIPNDYKFVRIIVSWTGGFQEKNVIAYTNISPRGLETSTGGGTLTILVYDANGLPIDLADVLIQNDLVNPVINLNDETDEGTSVYYGAVTSTEGYRITVSEPGYSVSSTTDRTLENPNPTKPHASVIEDWETEITFYIDKVSNLNITTISQDLLDNWIINTDGSGENQINPDFAVDPSGNLYFVWEDYSDTSDSKIYSQKYDLTPASLWAGDKIVSSANKQINPSIASDSAGNFYIIWNDDRNGNQDAYFIKTDSDGNDLWGGDKKINTDAGNEDQVNPQVAISEIDTTATSTVVWQDNRNSDWDIYAQRFDSNGIMLWTNDLKVNNDGTATDQYSAVLAIDSTDNIYITWTDERNITNKDVYAQKYDASGSKLWAASDLKANNDGTTTDQYSPALAIDSSNNIYIVWTDERNTNKDVYIQKYNSGGSKLWAASDLKANNDGTTTDQYSPDLAIDSSDNIYIVWTDERNGNKDIYAQKYDADGNKLWVDDLRINITIGDSEQDNAKVIINPSDGKAYACWQDNRDGNYDVYASPIEPYGAITYLASVPVTITGAKRIGEDPIIYKYTNNQTSDSNGAINLVDIEWDSYTVELQTGYSGHSIIMSNPSIPINLLPDETQDLILYLE